MVLVLEIIGLLFMVTLMFVGIWGFILANQAYSQLRYQNYLLEKLTQNIYMLTCRKESAPAENKDEETLTPSLEDEEL